MSGDAAYLGGPNVPTGRRLKQDWALHLQPGDALHWYGARIGVRAIHQTGEYLDDRLVFGECDERRLAIRLLPDDVVTFDTDRR